MKRLILGLCAAVAISCGGGKPSGGPTHVVAIDGYTATRWIPAQATYAIAAHTLREAQQGIRDLVDTFGVFAEVSVSDVSKGLAQVLLVDPLNADALGQIGIDVEGGFALYSDAMNPTIAVRLTSPQAFQAFIDAQPKLRLQSVVVEGTEMFTSPVSRDFRISWVITDGWLLVHFALPTGPDDGQSWFTASRQGKPAWAADFAGNRGEPVIGFVDAGKFFADAQAKFPEVAQCASTLQLGSGIGHLAFSMSGDQSKMNARFALDLGPLAPRVDASTMPVPEGWANVTAQVPIAAQWNLDLAAIRARFGPCLKLADVDLRELDEFGVRAGRAFIRTFDPEDRKGTGAAALDLSHKDFFAAKLDDIPMRSAFERKRTFGPYAGKSIAIPMFLTVDYVLTDQLALAGVGEGLLLQLVGRGGTQKGPLFELALQPLGLSVESWTELLGLVDIDNPKLVAERLLKWREARLTASLDGTRLVLSASGTRR